MCNLYAIMEARAEIARLARAMTDRNNNQPPMPSVYPDYPAPVIVTAEDGSREMRNMRWGMPTSKQALLQGGHRARRQAAGQGHRIRLRRAAEDGAGQGHHQCPQHHERPGQGQRALAPWLGAANRCLVPFTSFAEPDQDHERTRKNIWFALDDSRPLAFFAGVWTPHACVRMKSKGWEEIEAYGFLTTDSAEPVKTYHSKAMPVILTEEAEWDLWMSGAPWEEVRHLQRSLPEGALKIVATGARQDDTVPVRTPA